MRDITKSILSYTWAMSLFGVQQTANVFRRGKERDNRAAEVFEDVTDAVTAQLDDTLKVAFRAADNLQRGLVDAVFGMAGTLNVQQWAQSAERMGSAARDACRSASGRDNGHDTADGQMPSGSSFGRTPSGSAPGS
jgi:hypothetical protein